MSDPREFRHLPVHELIRRFAQARRAGDRNAEPLWEALVVKTFDRVKQSVKGFRFPNGQALRPDQRDDAIQDAYLRVRAMASTFDGASEGEYFAALHTCVWFACMDFGRDELRHEKGIGGSLDEPAFEAEGDRGRYDDALEADARRRDREALEKLEDEARRRRDHDLVAWGISQVGNDNYRKVLELTFLEKLDGEQIAARLDITTDNVYARRSRGLKQLEEVLRDRRP